RDRDVDGMRGLGSTRQPPRMLEYQRSNCLLNEDEHPVHLRMRQRENLVWFAEIAHKLELGVLCCSDDATVVDDAVAEDAKVAERINSYFVRLDAPDRSGLRSDVFVPVRKKEYDDAPAQLLFVETRLRILTDQVICPDDPVMYHFRSTQIFYARMHDDRLATLDALRNRTLYPSNLAFDARCVPSESG